MAKRNVVSAYFSLFKFYQQHHKHHIHLSTLHQHRKIIIRYLLTADCLFPRPLLVARLCFTASFHSSSFGFRGQLFGLSGSEPLLRSTNCKITSATSIPFMFSVIQIICTDRRVNQYSEPCRP
jgi:hypothetical protein